MLSSHHARILAATLVVALYGLFNIGPAAAKQPSGCWPLKHQSLDLPLNIGLLRSYLIFYRCTDYDGEVAQALSAARDWIIERAPQVTNPAIVLDIDETSLSNWEQLYHNQFGYFKNGPCNLKPSAPSCGQSAWELSASATAIKPTLELFNIAQNLYGRNGEKVAIFFVTGRIENPRERIATERNLRKAGYKNWKQLILRPASSEKDPYVSCFKTKARMKIESDHFTIIANIGDQLSDLIGGHAERTFKIPNPFYFLGGVSDDDLGCAASDAINK
jgi:acid phosphatase